MADPFEAALAEHRPELLRHCYRMLGSFQDAEEAVQEALESAWKGRASYAGTAPLRHWFFRIATNTCLNAKKARARRLPELYSRSAQPSEPLPEPADPESWLTPAPDHALWPAGMVADPARASEERESVALAFLALLQELPPKPRAALLLRDVVGFSVQEIADALELSPEAVASALHRGRARLSGAPPRTASREPPPAIVAEFVRCWEQRDLTGLLALLREDVVLTMPPFPIWFQGREQVGQFFQSERFDRFWASGLRLVPVRANAEPAVLYYRERGTLLHSIQLTSFDGQYFTRLPTFIGEPYLAGFS